MYTCVCMQLYVHVCMCIHGTALYNAVYIYSGGRGAMRYCICIMLCTYIYYNIRYQAAGCCTVLCCAVSASL